MTPPGGDLRYRYVKFGDLSVEDKASVRSRYHKLEHIPDEEYLYPVKKNGRLADARRCVSLERARELFHLHEVRVVQES